jgi:heat shock protein HslJ
MTRIPTTMMLLLTATVLAAGCGASGGKQPAAMAAADDGEADPLTALVGEWTLTHIDDQPLVDDVTDRPPTLTIDAEGQVAGFAGVNRYFGALDVEKLRQGEFVLGPLGSTRMAGPPDRMELERRYLQRLGDADRAAAAGRSLQLTSEGKPALTFVRPAPAEEAEPAAIPLAALQGEWTLTHIEGRPLADDVKDRPPTLMVNDEGRLGGFAGVNRYFGQLDLEKLAAGRFDAGQIGSTLMAGDPARMALEASFTRLLGEADGAAPGDDVLQLTKGGRVVLTFARAGR